MIELGVSEIEQGVWAERVIDRLPSGLAVVNSKLELEWTNSTFQSMLPFSRQLGRWPETEFSALRGAVAELMNRAGNSESDHRVVEDSSQTPGRSNRYFMVYLDPLPEESAFLLDVRDYTDRKKEQDEAEQKDRLASLGFLSMGIAHEINNPNAFIRLSAANLASFQKALHPLLMEWAAANPDKKIGGSPVPEMLEKIDRTIEAIQTGSSRVLQVVETLKSFGRQSPEPYSETDINEAAEKALEMSRYLSREVAEIDADFSDDLPPVWGSSLELEQVLINLISNAWQSVKIQKERAGEAYIGRIRITTSYAAADRTVSAKVSDNGIGIKEEDRARLFSPFFTTKPHGEGTGLGLSLGYRIVERHNGQLQFESRPGEGAEFILKLPEHLSASKEVNACRDTES